MDLRIRSFATDPVSATNNENFVETRVSVCRDRGRQGTFVALPTQGSSAPLDTA